MESEEFLHQVLYSYDNVHNQSHAQLIYLTNFATSKDHYLHHDNFHKAAAEPGWIPD